MLKKSIAAVIGCLLAVCTVYAQVPDNWYQNKPINAIVFRGLKNVARADIDGIFETYKGTPFTDELYSDILQKLYALDYFSDIVPNAVPADSGYHYVRLEFDVVEKPAIRLIKITGSRQISKGEILSKTILKKDDIYNEIKKNADVQTLKNYYIEKGYASAKIEAVVSDHPKGGVILEYIIDEGKQTVVSAVHFQGNTIAGDKALKNVLVTKPTRFLIKGIFKEAALEEDKVAIQRFYGERGYIDAHVENIIQEVDTETDPRRNIVQLTYVIMEGEQYTYDGVILEGNRIFSTEELTSYIKLNRGAVLNMTKFERGYQAIIDTYFENGYTSNYINQSIRRDEATKQVSFLISIIEQERSHIENIIIRGNKKTQAYVIRRELLLEPGDVFSKGKFTDSLRNLFNLRYFSAVVPEFQQGSEQNLIDVVLNVEEQSTANVQFGVAFSGVSDAESFPLSVFVQWQERNFLGRGNEFSISGNAGVDTQTIQTGYTHNWFLGLPITLGFDLSLTHKLLYDYQDVLFPIFSDQDALEAAKRGEDVPPDPYTSWSEYLANPSLAHAYRMQYHRMETTFGIHSAYRWFPRYCTITLRGGINFSLVKNFYDTGIYRPADRTVRRQQARWGLSNSLWSRVSFDGRDLAYDPSRGWFLSQQVSFFGIFPKIEDEYFFRSETKAEGYIPLVDYPVSEIWNLKFVLAFYSGFSFQLPMPNSIIGENSKLAIDGVFTGKGWIGLGPSGRGNVLLNHWAEFRWPLAHGILSFDFFFDSVAVKRNLADLNTLSLNDYYFSFGPGLRFVIPQFPLRLMFANTFKSVNGKPQWSNGKNANWQFVLSFNIPNL